MKNLAVLLLLLISSMLFAQTDFKPEVKIGGTLFTGWEFNIDNANFISKLDTNKPDGSVPFGYAPLKNQFETSQNNFFLDRGYINVFASLTPEIKGRFTPDIYSATDGSGKTQFFLQFKYAFLTYTPFQKDNGMTLGFTAGILPNRWIEKTEGYFGYRGIAKVITDYSWVTGAAPGSGASKNIVAKSTGSYFSSADIGLDAAFTAPKGYAEIYASVLNGSGFRNLSFDNRFKDILVSAFVHPLAGQISKKWDAAKQNKKDRISGLADLTLGGFAYIGKLDKGENTNVNPSTGNTGVQYQRNRFGGMLHIRFNLKDAGFINFGSELSLASNTDPSATKIDSAAKTNSMGISAYVEFNPPVKSINEKLMLLVRYDMFDPNTDNLSATTTSFNDNTDKQSLLIAGLVFKPNKVLTLAGSYQSTTYQLPFVTKYDGSTSKTDAKLVLHGILNF